MVLHVHRSGSYLGTIFSIFMLDLFFCFFQGFNTGIVLYHLQNMRKSQKYNNYVHPETGAEETISLAKHYQYSSHLGDQVSIFLNKKLYIPR